MAPGVKSGATFRICAMEITMSAAFRGWLPGLEIATLIFLICGAPGAAAAQRAGNIHRNANNLLCIRFSILSNRGKANEINFSSRNVVFPAGCEDIDYERILDARGAVSDAPADNESVPRAQFDRFPLSPHFPIPTHTSNPFI